MSYKSFESFYHSGGHVSSQWQTSPALADLNPVAFWEKGNVNSHQNTVCSIFTNHLRLLFFTSVYVIRWGWITFLWLDQQNKVTKISHLFRTSCSRYHKSYNLAASIQKYLFYKVCDFSVAQTKTKSHGFLFGSKWCEREGLKVLRWHLKH